MKVLREHISSDGIMRSSEVVNLSPETRVRTAGCVVCRQAPRTARGYVFPTLEDEEGLVNVILKPHIYQKYRYVARMEPFIVVEGLLQKRDGIVNIVAERLFPLRQEALYPAPKARNFA